MIVRFIGLYCVSMWLSFCAHQDESRCKSISIDRNRALISNHSIETTQLYLDGLTAGKPFSCQGYYVLSGHAAEAVTFNKALALAEAEDHLHKLKENLPIPERRYFYMHKAHDNFADPQHGVVEGGGIGLDDGRKIDGQTPKTRFKGDDRPAF